LELKQKFEQVIDESSIDELRFAGVSEEAKKKAKDMVTSFERYIQENKDEIDALKFFYSEPYKRRLRFNDIKKLAENIKAPPRSWTPEILWRAYQLLDKDKVKGASGQRLLTDIVSLVRFAIHKDSELVPFQNEVQERFVNWRAQQENKGRKFSPEQVKWLEMMKDHIANSIEMELEDFDLVPFAEEGGLGKARQVFGAELKPLLEELNRELAA
jgi:type I restriction enzyme R subunit